MSSDVGRRLNKIVDSHGKSAILSLDSSLFHAGLHHIFEFPYDVQKLERIISRNIELRKILNQQNSYICEGVRDELLDDYDRFLETLENLQEEFSLCDFSRHKKAIESYHSLINSPQVTDFCHPLHNSEKNRAIRTIDDITKRLIKSTKRKRNGDGGEEYLSFVDVRQVVGSVVLSKISKLPVISVARDQDFLNVIQQFFRHPGYKKRFSNVNGFGVYNLQRGNDETERTYYFSVPLGLKEVKL